MKKILVAVMFGLMAIAAQAEATFDQIQGLIEQHQYQAAASGLETIIQNHPKSAKAFYAMAQAQAGLGNLEKANKALNIATGLNPTLDFAPASSVASLKQAITPQVAKIEAVEESHALRNFIYFALFAGFGVAIYFMWGVYNRNKDEEEAAEAERKAAFKKSFAEKSTKADPMTAPVSSEGSGYASTADKAMAARTYVPPVATPAPAPTYTPTPAPVYSAPPTHTTVVNNNSSNDGLLTGMILGNMMSNHHETTRVVEREVIREVPAPSRGSSWDDNDVSETKTVPSRSSSWDDTPSRSSSRSSSWDDDSSSRSSSSSSSWSSSSSDSSSSWSDSSSSSSDSGSSWD